MKGLQKEIARAHDGRKEFVEKIGGEETKDRKRRKECGGKKERGKIQEVYDYCTESDGKDIKDRKHEKRLQRGQQQG